MPNKKKKFKQDPSEAIESFSKNLLSLKFMQRAKKEAEKVAEKKDDPLNSSFCLSPCVKGKQQYIINPSYQFCERLRFGRFSFKGMNTDIESIMYNNQKDKEVNVPAKRSAMSSACSSDSEDDTE